MTENLKNYDWIEVERPGYLGSKRSQKESEWNIVYGIGNWRYNWKNAMGELMTYEEIFEHYVLGYVAHFVQHTEELDFLVRNALFLYDINPDITREQAFDLHYGFGRPGLPNEFHHSAMNIAIEERLGVRFMGKQPLQIRGLQKEVPIEKWPLTAKLQPGYIKCVKPELITPPLNETWWIRKDSVEGLYQYNKIIEIRR